MCEAVGAKRLGNADVDAEVDCDAGGAQHEVQALQASLLCENKR